MIRLFLFFFLILISSRSYSLVPGAAYALGGGPEVASPAAAVSSGAAVPFAVGAAAFSVGMAAGYFLFDDLLGNFTRLPTADEGAGGAHAVPAPTGVAPTATPIAGKLFIASHGGCNGQGATPDAACNGVLAACGLQPYYTIEVCSDAVFSLKQTSSGSVYTYTAPDDICNDGGCFYSVADTSTSTCPAGYTNVSGQCNLTDPRQAAPDNNCDMKRVNGVYTNMTDPDCGPANTEIANCLAMGEACSLRFLDADGYPVSVDIRPTANGGTSIDYYEQQPTKPDGTTPIQHTHVGIDPPASPTEPPKVGEVSGGTGTGSIPADGTQPVTNTPGQSSSIQFPSDYARVGEASQAADKITTSLAPKLDTIHKDLSDVSTVADPANLTIDDMPKFGATFDGLLAWRLPAHTSACPQPEFDLQNILGTGRVYTMTSHCSIISNNASIIQNSMLVFWSIMGILIILRA